MIDLTQPEVKLALQVVGQGADVAQQVRTAMADRNLTKDDLSPVTVADFASQALAARAMQRVTPGVALVGEESADELRTDEGAEVRKLVAEFVAKFDVEATEASVCDWIDYGTAEPNDCFWTLDPIDGTKGYLRGGQYAVAFALIKNGQVELGALGCPNLGEGCAPDMGKGVTLLAQRGQGSWLSVAGSDFQQVHVSSRSNIADARVMRSVEDSHTNASQIDALNAALGVTAEPVRMDSQAKYSVLAVGGGDLLFRLLNPGREDYKECIWDQAAGAIILEEAGGRITDLRGKALDFGQGRKLLKNTGVLASNGTFHEAALAAIAEVCTLP